jgi:hypothetical protein
LEEEDFATKVAGSMGAMATKTFFLTIAQLGKIITMDSQEIQTN